MAQRTGTFDISSLIAVQNTSAIEYGLDTIAEVLRRDNEIYNRILTEVLSDLAVTTTDRQRTMGATISGDMQEADEYSRIPTQKDSGVSLLGFPLRKFQFAVGWTRAWIKRATPADFAIKQQAAQGADTRRHTFELKKALFTPTNSTFVDYHVDRASLAVKALINADSSTIPTGPNGESFDGATHTHYNASATLTAAAVQALIDDVVEHGHKRVRVYINIANETAFRALAGFVAYPDQRLILGTQANQLPANFDPTVMDNRPIGIFGAAEVWTKPWVPANYAVAISLDTPPLARRVDTTDAGLHFEATIETFPLQADYMENSYGFGAWNRTAAAVLKFDNAAYSAPVLTY